MKLVHTFAGAAIASLMLATGAFAQSGEMTQAKCIEDILDREQAAKSGNGDKSRQKMALQSVDTNQDGTISRDEAQKACSGASDESLRQQKMDENKR